MTTKASAKGTLRETPRETQIDKTNVIARQIIQSEADRRTDLTATLRAARLARNAAETSATDTVPDHAPDQKKT